MSNKKMVQCKACSKDIAKGVKKCPSCGKDQRGFFMRHKILTGILVIVILSAIGSALGGGDETPNIEVENKVGEKDEVGEPEETKGIEEVEETQETEDIGKIPREYKAALKKAETYSNTMHMSKKGIYNQLVSEYGEDFPQDAAQYAIDNVKADWNKNALKKAETYSSTMHMSKVGIYNQLISEHGEQFNEEEAQYAVDNIKADWNKNALEKAKTYAGTMSMSDSDIYDQLVSEYGEQFTKEEAQYAIDNLE